MDTMSRLGVVIALIWAAIVLLALMHEVGSRRYVIRWWRRIKRTLVRPAGAARERQRPNKVVVERSRQLRATKVKAAGSVLMGDNSNDEELLRLRLALWEPPYDPARRRDKTDAAPSIPEF
jgi:hypothetical protein